MGFVNYVQSLPSFPPEQQTEASYLQETATDDREGELELPTAGTITTYLFEETRNVHYYYDNTSGNWVRLPISWELRSQLIQSLLEPIEVRRGAWITRDTYLSLYDHIIPIFCGVIIS